VKDHDIHFGERDWQRLQEILLKQGIEPSERYIIRDRFGKDYGAA
jgi:hypothetical protein